MTTLSPGVCDRHHGGHHGLGGAASDYDILVGVHRHAHKMLLLGGKRLTHGLGAPGDGVLVIERLGIGGDGAEAIEQLRRGSKSGKPCDRLTAPYLLEMRVMRRMTESVNAAVRLESSFMPILSSIGWSKFTPMEPVGFARNGLEKLFSKFLKIGACIAWRSLQ